jgi:hypothetical protein
VDYFPIISCSFFFHSTKFDVLATRAPSALHSRNSLFHLFDTAVNKEEEITRIYQKNHCALHCLCFVEDLKTNAISCFEILGTVLKKKSFDSRSM